MTYHTVRCQLSRCQGTNVIPLSSCPPENIQGVRTPCMLQPPDGCLSFGGVPLRQFRYLASTPRTHGVWHVCLSVRSEGAVSSSSDTKSHLPWPPAEVAQFDNSTPAPPHCWLHIEAATSILRHQECGSCSEGTTVLLHQGAAAK